MRIRFASTFILVSLLVAMPAAAATKQEIKTKILESYHNGQKGDDSGGKPDGGWKGRFSKRFSKPRQYSKPRA